MFLPFLLKPIDRVLTNWAEWNKILLLIVLVGNVYGFVLLDLDLFSVANGTYFFADRDVLGIPIVVLLVVLFLVKQLLRSHCIWWLNIVVNVP